MPNIIERKVYSQEQLPEKLDVLVEEIRSVYDPEQIVLFGSAAQGLPWHDLDLLVIAETEDGFYERLRKIASVKRSWIPSDIIVYTPDELLQQVKANRSFIVQEVLGKGRTIYAHGDRVQLNSQVARPAIEDLEEGVAPLTDGLETDAKAWLEQAGEDLRFASHALVGDFYAQSCFASQQSVEKLLKAFLFANGRTLPRTHALPLLLALCGDVSPKVASLEEQAALLDGYYIATRYPDITLPEGPYSKQHAVDARDVANQFFVRLEQATRDLLGQS